MKYDKRFNRLYLPVSLVLLLAAGTCKGQAQNIMAALLAAWTILMVLSSFSGARLHAKAETDQKAESLFFFRRKPDRNPIQPDTRTTKPDSTPYAKPDEDTGTPDSRMGTLNEVELSQLMQHISLRISDKLKSA